MDEFEIFFDNEFDIDDDSYLLDVDVYDYYIKDINSLNKVIDEDRNKLIVEIILIIKELNSLFDLVINDIQLEDGRIVPWISDKVNYCIYTYWKC